MKMRNRKTGKIQTCDMVVITDEQMDGEIASLNRHTFLFRSIEQFNDEYEDYKPAEPLIKDEKIREITRLWAKINGATELKYYEDENCLEDIFRNEIHFNQPLCLEDGKTYTIAELCGEDLEKCFAALEAWGRNTMQEAHE